MDRRYRPDRGMLPELLQDGALGVHAAALSLLPVVARSMMTGRAGYCSGNFYFKKIAAAIKGLEARS